MRTIIAAICFLVIGTYASAQDKPRVISEEEALRWQIYTDTIASWRKSDFEKLGRIAEEFTSKRSKTLTGKWRLDLYASALESEFTFTWPKEFNTRADDTGCNCQAPAPRHYAKADVLWNLIGAQVDTWIAKYPQSPHAINAKAAYLIKRAWFYRGSGFSSTVPDEAWPIFNDYIARARVLLESTRKVSIKSPLWFSNMFTIQMAQSWPRPAYEALIKDFLANGQNYPGAYFDAFSGLQPKWGGSFAAMDAFARNAAARTRNEEGAGLYTRLYWNIHVQYGNKLFEETQVDWSTMRQGFLDIIARYPESRNLNGFAMFSCMARDYASAALAIKKMGHRVDPNLWQNVSLSECQRAIAEKRS